MLFRSPPHSARLLHHHRPHPPQVFYPGQYVSYASRVTLTYACVIIAGLLCLASADAYKRRLSWARFAGGSACVLLIPGFPWLTPLGLIGLYFIIAKPATLRAVVISHPTIDPWQKKHGSQTQALYLTLCGAAMCYGYFFIERVAAARHLSEWRPGYYLWFTGIGALTLAHVEGPFLTPAVKSRILAEQAHRLTQHELEKEASVFAEAAAMLAPRLRPAPQSRPELVPA